MKLIDLGIALIILFLSAQAFTQGTDNWIEFQTIPADGQKVHAITYENGLLAVNFNNTHVAIYHKVMDQWEIQKVFEIKWVWDEFGTMRFNEGFLYVSIDGHKYYKIDIEKEKIRKTNTYKAGFYIISRKDFEYFGKEWIFKLNEKGDILVYYNKPLFSKQYIDSLRKVK